MDNVTPSILPPVDSCEGILHRFIPGDTICLCGELTLSDAPFVEYFWDQMEQAKQDGAVLDIARYCKVCGESEFDAHQFNHEFDPDIPYDWDGK